MLKDIIAGEDGETAVIAFDHNVVHVQEFTNDTGQITETMKKLKPGSSQPRRGRCDHGRDQHAKEPGSAAPAHSVVDCRKTGQRQPTSRARSFEAAEFANVAIYSLDISSIVAGLTSTGMPPPPPAIPAAAQHMPAGGDATPTSIDQNYYMGNYIPVFVDIFKGVKSMFVEDPVVVFTRFTGGKEYPFISEKSLERAIAGNQPGTSQPVPAELHAEQSY